MTATAQLAQRFREVMLNGQWIANTNWQQELMPVDWHMATSRFGTLNSIASLTFHLDYYISGVLQVLRGGPLSISDRFSFDTPSIDSEASWQQLRDGLLQHATAFAAALEALPDTQLSAVFDQPQYGDYQRNIEGMIEHAYYHLGQVVLLK